MNGIILAGGTGSRLYPLTKVTNKHLLPVGKIPMIEHCVNKLTEVGIKEIIVVTGTEHMGDIVSLLGSGKNYNCKFTYKVQDEPDGIAGALSLCENSCTSADGVVVLLGDNIFQDSLHSCIKAFKSGSESRCILNLKRVEDPSRFGVATLENKRVVEIIEKPKNPKSDYCVTGIYAYTTDVFEVLKTLKKSNRNEYEITDVNNFYVNTGNCEFNVLDGWWTDAGTHSSYKIANDLCQEID
jgi:glucose-1-phosphate thymidylyltransferase